MFQSRREAGLQLLQQLQPLALQNVVVVAQPAAGVLVAEPIAQAYHAPLDVMVTRKLKVVGQSGIAYGAVGPNGVRLLDEATMADYGVTPKALEQATAWELNEVNRRLKRYRQDMPPLDLKGKTVLYVDDGMDTGLTALAAVFALKKLQPGRLIVAVPISSPEATAWLAEYVDAVVTLSTPDDFDSIAAAYKPQGPISDQEIMDLLRSFLG